MLCHIQPFCGKFKVDTRVFLHDQFDKKLIVPERFSTQPVERFRKTINQYSAKINPPLIKQEIFTENPFWSLFELKNLHLRFFIQLINIDIRKRYTKLIFSICTKEN